MQQDGPSPLGGASRLVADLESFVADGAADMAVDGRRRARHLAEQATEEATLVGVLLDLAEREVRVVVTTTGGRQHRGTVVLVGIDVIALSTEPRGVSLVRTDAVAQVRTAPGSTVVRGDRVVHLQVRWAEALAVLATDRPRVHAALAGGSTCTGELRSVGADVATLRLDGEGGSVYVPLGAIDDVVVDDVMVTDSLR